MASGLVVFLPSYMEPNFGDGAIYADPTTVHEKVRELWADAEEVRAQGSRARAMVMSRYSADAFQQRLRRLMDVGEQKLQTRSADDA
jgi:hypothetical protein